MKDVYIVEGLRTPVARRGKSLKNVSAVKLASAVILKLLENNKLDGGSVDEVILGNAVSAGLGQNPARQALIRAGLPHGVPGVTVDMVCGSGVKGLIMASQAIVSGDAGCIIAGGAESASQCPSLFLWDEKEGKLKEDEAKSSLINDGLFCRLNGEHMVGTAERTAEKFKISRGEQDAYAAESHRRAGLAQEKGYFKEEIVPIAISADRILDADEKHAAVSLESLARMKPVLGEGGTVTPGNSPSPADGAAALIIASGKACKELNLVPRARILGYSSVGVEPALTFTGAAAAVRKCLKASSIDINDVDLFEIGESFAVQAILTLRELALDHSKVNVFGGTIAFGHPLGASGARGLVTLLGALKKLEKKVGLTSICLGGGSAVSLAVEML
ncbi:MAG: thiolase family protein [Candidatus Omnitrophica bacterium]|nr:thiolase family protein [Candidatus Omnitrophota bacterium]